MAELLQQYSFLIWGILILEAILLIACLIRSIMGPKNADRLMAVNMIGTIVTTIIAILAYLMDETFLLDICIVYALASFLAVVMLTKVYMGIYKEKRTGTKGE